MFISYLSEMSSSFKDVILTIISNLKLVLN